MPTLSEHESKAALAAYGVPIAAEEIPDDAVGDVAFATAPVTTAEAHGMIASLRSTPLLGAFRGEPPVDRDELAAILVGLGRLAVERPDVASVDVNPLVVRAGRPVAVDALV